MRTGTSLRLHILQRTRLQENLQEIILAPVERHFVFRVLGEFLVDFPVSGYMITASVGLCRLHGQACSTRLLQKWCTWLAMTLVRNLGKAANGTGLLLRNLDSVVISIWQKSLLW